MTTPPLSVQVKYTLYTVSDYQQLMKCNDHKWLQISRSFNLCIIIKACCHVEKEIKKSKTITSNECAFRYSVKRCIVKLKVIYNVMTNMIKRERERERKREREIISKQARDLLTRLELESCFKYGKSSFSGQSVLKG